MICPTCGGPVERGVERCPWCQRLLASVPSQPALTDQVPMGPPAPAFEPASDGGVTSADAVSATGLATSPLVHCPRCGEPSPASAAYCAHCGAPLVQRSEAAPVNATLPTAPPSLPMPFPAPASAQLGESAFRPSSVLCPACGHSNLPDDAYCVRCGSSLGVLGDRAQPDDLGEGPALQVEEPLATPVAGETAATPAATVPEEPARKRRGCCLALVLVGLLALIALAILATQVAKEINRTESVGGVPVAGADATAIAAPTAVAPPTAVTAPTAVLSEGAAAPLLDPARAVAVASQEVGAEGGSLAVFDLTSALYGLEVHVPAGALGAGDRAMLLASQLPEPPALQLADMAQEDPTLIDQLDALVASPPDPALAYHPVWQAPAMLAGEWDLISPLVLLEPEGYAFEQPVLVTLPLDAEAIANVVDPLDLLVMGRSVVDGVVRWEIVREYALDRESATVIFETTHFSSWGAWLWRKTGNALYAGYLHTYAFSDVLAVEAQLPQDTVKNLVTAMVCSEAALKNDMANAPSRWELLMFLGFSAGSSKGQLHGSFYDVEQRLNSWLVSLSPLKNPGGTDLRQPGTVGPEEIFARALREANGDVFYALVATHGVLRDSRTSTPIQQLYRTYRPDGGDNSGAYYHLFGAAMYAFAHEHYTDNPIARPVDFALMPLLPEYVVLGEETFFASEGGDIRGDTMEYALDRQGVAIGRALYQAFTGMGTGEMAQAYGIDPVRDCQKPEVQPTTQVATLWGDLSNLKPQAPTPVMGLWWGWWQQDAAMSSWISGGCPVYPLFPLATDLTLYLAVDYDTGHMTGTWSGSAEGQTAGFSPPDVVRQVTGTVSGTFDGGNAILSADGKGFTFEGQGTTVMNMSGTISCPGKDDKSTAGSMTLPTTIRGEWREGKGFVSLEAGSEELGMRFTIWAVDPPFKVTP